MNHSEKRRAGGALGLAQRLPWREGREALAVPVSERRAAAASEHAVPPWQTASNPLLEEARRDGPARSSPDAFRASPVGSSSPGRCASSLRDTRAPRAFPARLERLSPPFLFLLLCLVQCLSFAAVDARLVVIYPDTLATYPPILETYFAPWSANFTSVSGRLRYFAKTCDLEHYFYRDVSELEADPASVFKGLHALHFFQPDRVSTSLSRLAPSGSLRGDSRGEDADLMRGAFRRLQETFLPQTLSLPWGWISPQETDLPPAPGRSAAVRDRQAPWARNTTGEGVSAADGVSVSDSRPREEVSPSQEREDSVARVSRPQSDRRPPAERPGDTGKRDARPSAFSGADSHTSHSLSPPFSSSSACPGCAEREPSGKAAALISQWARPALSFLGDVSTSTPLSSHLPAAHHVLARRGVFSWGPLDDAGVAESPARAASLPSHPALLLAMDSSTPSFLLPQSSHRPPSAARATAERKMSQRQAEREEKRQGEGGERSRVSPLWASLFDALGGSPSSSDSQVSSAPGGAPALEVAASTSAALSRGLAWLFGPSSAESAADASVSNLETPAGRSLFSSSAARPPVLTQASLDVPEGGASPTASEFPDFPGATGEVNADPASPAPSPEGDTAVRVEFGQVLWFFDQCNNPEDVERLVHAANMNGVAALIFTNTTFSNSTEKQSSLASRDWWKKLVTSAPGAPQPLMPVLSVSDTRLSREIKERLRTGDTVEVDIDMLPADYVNCAVLQPVKWASLLFIPLWGAVTLVWYTLCNYVQAYDVSPLHRLLLLPPLLKTMFMVTAFGFYAQCPNYLGSSTQYIMMAYMGLNTIFNTIFYGVLLLLAKGFMVTREAFGRKESLSLAVLVSLVYIVTSVNQVEEAETLPALLLLYVALMITVLMSAARNVRHLELRLAYVRLVQVQDWEEALNVKLKMFRSLYRFSTAFFLLQIIQKLSLFEVFDRQDLSEIAGSALEWIFFIGVAAVFRPREEIRYFSLMQRTPETHTILPMYAAGPYVARGAEGEDSLFEGDSSASLLPSEANQPPPSVWTRLKAACCSIFGGPSPGLAGERETLRRSSEDGDADGVAVDSLPFRGGDGRPRGGSPIVILNPAADEEEPTGYLSLHNLAVGTLVPTPRKYSPDRKTSLLSTALGQNPFGRATRPIPSQQSRELRPPSPTPNDNSTPPEPSAEPLP
ncbi:conserved hypothetical protein [Neospora caninum Liverpool]|uniref:Transmembrane protein n=1 Tax=Neospora caninum (strain Liverpool) TaxID=572307 RepID=F0V9M5_NEOCL|nr:conserved hypothetical protein [Neospora caninum Liverpool]CBZ50451.1 conserved hypothetical protein [Neospora caninum Liverpool]CEL65060.1 TPA: hypothetical protein BN1204_009200 [Neospora caninum Liverpool]|eukprot:XP_003880484.1 conserved hypothetical protein [Neospora caninum Liverpool]